MKPIVCPCGFGYDGDKFADCPQLSNHAAHFAEEAEETRRGEMLAEVFGLKKNGARYVTTWGNKTALGLFRTAERIIKDGK